jgi:predicted AAA+ superfamily ATPase
MFPRTLNISKSNSFILLGPRGTGKSSHINQLFEGENVAKYDLLDPELSLRFQSSPGAFKAEIEHASKRGLKWIVIDEIQKAPELLDLVHQAIEQKGLLFALSGSSARKLKRGGANLLAGRAFVYNLHPLTHVELGDEFKLNDALTWGTLPKVVNLKDGELKKRFLTTYAQTYIQEEIQAENIIRKLPPFRRFLGISSQSITSIVNYRKIAADAQTDPKNVQSYFQILEDTLLGFFLESFHTSIRKRQRQSPKFYWFDCGVQRALSQTLDLAPVERTYEYGKLFESFIINEIKRALEYSGKQFQLSHLRSDENTEIDLIVERAGQPTLLIEIKSSTDIREEHIASLSRLSRDIKGSRSICLYRGASSKIISGVEILPWKEGIFEALQISRI